MGNDDDLYWNPEERHKMSNDKEPTEELITGEPGDIIECNGTTYRVLEDGSFQKI